MKVVDSGHHYILDSIDGELPQELIFVKREGAMYPGNVGHHAGTTLQEVLRALIERAIYVNNQTLCEETTRVIQLLIASLVLLEERAARRHGRTLNTTVEAIVSGDDKCPKCGHIGCQGH